MPQVISSCVETLTAFLKQHQLKIDLITMFFAFTALYLKGRGRQAGWLFHLPKKILGVVVYGLYRRRYIKLISDLILLPLILLGYHFWKGQADAEAGRSYPLKHLSFRGWLCALLGSLTALILMSLIYWRSAAIPLKLLLGSRSVAVADAPNSTGQAITQFYKDLPQICYVSLIITAYLLLAQKIASGWLFAIGGHLIFILDLLWFHGDQLQWLAPAAHLIDFIGRFGKFDLLVFKYIAYIFFSAYSFRHWSIQIKRKGLFLPN